MLCDTNRLLLGCSELGFRFGLLVVLCLFGACVGEPSKDSSDSPVVCLARNAHALAVCARSKTLLHGIDVSVWQGAVDWKAAKTAGVTFAFARASDGTAHRDEEFKANWAGMRAQGVIRGAYQFFRPSVDALAQADLLIAMIEEAGGLAADDLPPVIDLEADEGVAPALIQQRALQWIARVEHVLKRKPIVYSGANFAPSIADACVDYPLWAPNYKASYQGACPTINEAWTRWVFWQWTSTGSIDGIDGDVDRNVFDGSLDDLKAFIASTHLTPPAQDDAGTMPPHDAGTLPPVTPTDPRDAGMNGDAAMQPTPALDGGTGGGGMGMGANGVGTGASPPVDDGCRP